MPTCVTASASYNDLFLTQNIFRNDTIDYGTDDALNDILALGEQYIIQSIRQFCLISRMMSLSQRLIE